MKKLYSSLRAKNWKSLQSVSPFQFECGTKKAVSVIYGRQMKQKVFAFKIQPTTSTGFGALRRKSIFYID